MQTRGTGSAGRRVRPPGTMLDRHLTGRHIDDQTRDEERRDPLGALLEKLGMRALDERQTTDSRTDDDTDAIGVVLVDDESRIIEGFLAGS